MSAYERDSYLAKVGKARCPHSLVRKFVARKIEFDGHAIYSTLIRFSLHEIGRTTPNNTNPINNNDAITSCHRFVWI